MSSSSAGSRIYYLVPTYRCPAMNRLYASRPDVQQLNSPSLQPTSTFGPLGRALWSCVASAPHRSSSVNAWILLWMKDRWGLTDRAGAELAILFVSTERTAFGFALSALAHSRDIAARRIGPHLPSPRCAGCL
ncbi:hypothetical protein FA13DRAFT_1730710 [Coprinellus micaceus]|uniref:Uncharacterized protein n=1 Tax=Coprinellus micaceus TaxID=71717 RepID=A0A4Y7THJ5_COPMI|nr:hypothetical protein FA13DRAFT_1730710 [Coprinellus micaceus]